MLSYGGQRRKLHYEIHDICSVYLRAAFISLVVYVGCGVYSRVAFI